jgi:hypothetical protein
MKSLLITLLVLTASAVAQTKASPAPEQFAGTYVGTWTSGYAYGAGAAALSITAENGALGGHVVITGSPVGYKGDELTITIAHFADDIMTIKFKAKHGRLTGSGILQNGTFVGDYRFRYLLSVDRGQWNMQK